MFQKLSTLDSLNDKLIKFETTMNTFVKNVDKITKRMNDFEKGMEFMNDKFASSKIERENLTSVSKLQTELVAVTQDVGQLLRNFDQLFERHLDLQTRTMRENLVFTGIPLSHPFETEDIKALISRLTANETKMDPPPIEFHRAHRFGKDSMDKNKDGTTLFKNKANCLSLQNFKDREAVRSAASELKGTRFGVNEQYHKEINDRRKSLWPFFKEAKNKTEA
ncbi:unnamed protein product [Mytilus coruscus]|uniref:Uncharacterized protein n=1 Tax=Mytilus coruscus TaxID=42192 RepID=A0A6J8EYN2_MYTCO|nr:unnamed protein product [Mytilus coruscus]